VYPLAVELLLQLAHAAADAAFEQLQDRQTAFEGVQFLAGLCCAGRTVMAWRCS
jgi:hypothetical protein